MTLSGKGFLSLTGITGVSSAVAVPLYLTTGEANESSSNIQSDNSLNQVSLTACTASDNQIHTDIDFGNQTFKEVCWRIKEKSENLKYSNDLTSLLKTQWENSNQNWNNNSIEGKWSQQCLDNTVSGQNWAVFNSDDVTNQYLGLCGNNSVAETPFVKKTKSVDNNNRWTLSVCDSNCFSTSSVTSTENNTPVVLQNEKAENWKILSFSQQ